MNEESANNYRNKMQPIWNERYKNGTSDKFISIEITRTFDPIFIIKTSYQEKVKRSGRLPDYTLYNPDARAIRFTN